MACLGEVLLALGVAVNHASDGVLTHVVDLSLHARGLLLLGDAWARELASKPTIRGGGGGELC